MMRTRPLLLALAMLAALLTPAEAHRLRLFATVTGDQITGRAFFVGGGRPNGATVTVRAADGRVIATVATDAEGAFSLRPHAPGPLTLTVDAGDGHAATTTLAADRFAPSAPPATPAPSAAPPAAGPASAAPLSLTPAELDAIVTTAVERAIRPLAEAQAEAEARIRFNDVMGGVGMLVGLTGIALWASARRRARAERREKP